MSPQDYTEDELVEQPAIRLFSELGWQTVSAMEEEFGEIPSPDLFPEPGLSGTGLRVVHSQLGILIGQLFRRRVELFAQPTELFFSRRPCSPELHLSRFWLGRRRPKLRGWGLLWLRSNRANTGC